LGAFLSFPSGFVAALFGWFTAEVGRQPWVVYGLLCTNDAVTPSLTTGDVLFSLVVYVTVYAVIYAFGFHYIYRLLRDGPAFAAEGSGDSTLARVPAVAMRATPGGGE
jgi:cytochrome d ubiquinol oxidase subunit I